MEVLSIFNGANPIHVDLANSVSSDNYSINERVTKEGNIFSNSFNLLKNTLSLPIKSTHQIALTESCYYYPALYRKFSLNKKLKIINMNCGPLLYNLLHGRISGFRKKLLLSLLKDVHGHLVQGDFGISMLEELNVDRSSIRVFYPYISDDRFNALSKIKPSLDSEQITILANTDWHNKGMDLVLGAFDIVSKKRPKATLNIAGTVNINTIPKKTSNPKIKIHGQLSNISSLFEKTSLYLQPSRGDTFGVAVLEALCSGIPAIVSTDTGAKEVVEKVSSNLICNLNEEELAQKILDYLDSSDLEKQKLSAAARKSILKFNRNEQRKNFKKAFDELCLKTQ
ncbi:MAG: glycosyltransferase family 4 protein [Candidatus Bilamarchaeum sp.]|jgi:glycosyltransferase involved in cell wall biosynthesis